MLELRFIFADGDKYNRSYTILKINLGVFVHGVYSGTEHMLQGVRPKYKNTRECVFNLIDRFVLKTNNGDFNAFETLLSFDKITYQGLNGQIYDITKQYKKNTRDRLEIYLKEAN